MARTTDPKRVRRRVDAYRDHLDEPTLDDDPALDDVIREVVASWDAALTRVEAAS